ncbi:type I site-specific deoxyribonuclease, HsdR family protein [Fischerella sp. NIES-4106]|nr:type I site-specific deoxyribonuclease, HsdR family protein [Fischerella sp. NIES-4106]
MNPGLPRRAILRASGIPTSFTRSFDSTTSAVPSSLLTWFDVIGYTVFLEKDIITFGNWTERSSITEVVLRDRLHSAVQRINPSLSSEAIAQAICQVNCIGNLTLFENNRHFHQLLTAGVDVTYQLNHKLVHEKVWLIDADNLLNNDWLVIHPFTVKQESYIQSLDVVVFINGLPLAVIIWNPIDETATLKTAYGRFQTHLQKLPKLFFYNAFVVIACGSRARVGTLTSDWQEYLPWRTIDGEDFPSTGETQLEVLIQGIFDKRRLLELVRHFLVFEENTNCIHKKFLRHPFCTICNPSSHKAMTGNHIF